MYVLMKQSKSSENPENQNNNYNDVDDCFEWRLHRDVRINEPEQNSDDNKNDY